VHCASAKYFPKSIGNLPVWDDGARLGAMSGFLFFPILEAATPARLPAAYHKPASQIRG
jgi:hypothetical protein